jgi:hypothetical protein
VLKEREGGSRMQLHLGVETGETSNDGRKNRENFRKKIIFSSSEFH